MTKRFLTLALIFLVVGAANAQQVGIGNNNPAPSAIVDVSSVSQGFLPPRLTFEQRNAIQNPAVGLVIWCSDCDEMQIYNGFMWTNMSGMAATTKSLPGIKICYHTWVYRNLAVRTYRNGDSIPVVTDPVAWSNLTTGAMCWYNNDSTANNPTYGALYNWYAVNDARGLAPTGWHLPNVTEWNILADCLGGNSTAGGKLKAVSLWTAPNTAAVNSSGFAGVPGGMRNSNGSFSDLGNYGYWWSTTPTGTNNIWASYLYYQSAAITNISSNKNAGYAVRCIKD